MSSPAIRLLQDGPAPGTRNMARDEALMEAARDGLVTLRLYRWHPPCLSLGRNERAREAYDAEEARLRGLDIVRRPTGGRAVYHDDELTYAVAAPAGLWGGLRESYTRINRALARGLRVLGVSAETSTPTIPGASAGTLLVGHACFWRPAPGEVTAAGRKLVGSAQWRHRGALLQHGSILLSDGQATVEELRRSLAPQLASEAPGGSSASAASPAASPAVGLEELLGRRPALGELRTALAAGFEEELGSAMEPGELTPSERQGAARLETRYRDESWTWRR